MPKSKHRRNGKKRTANPRPPVGGRMRKNRAFYDQPCPHDLLVEEFGDQGAEWLTEEYERPLNLADLELEKAIRHGAFIMDHPKRGATECTLAEVSRTTDLTTQVILDAAFREGLVTQEQLDEVDCGGLDHEEDGPDSVRAAHWNGGLFLNERGLWNFGAGE